MLHWIMVGSALYIGWTLVPLLVALVCIVGLYCWFIFEDLVIEPARKFLKWLDSGMQMSDEDLAKVKSSTI